MNAAGITAAEIADIPTEATLLGMAGAAAGSVTLGDYASGTWEGGRPVVPASERAGSLTGLGAPEGAVSMAAEALGHSPAADAAAHIAASARAPFADAAPPISEFSGVAGEIAAAGDGHGIRAGSGMPLSGEAAAMPLAPEGAVGFEIPAAERGGVVNAAPMPRDVMPGGVRDGGPGDAADMGGDLQPGFTTGGAAREGGDGGWLAQEETIEGVLPGHAARHAAKGAPVDAADMGGDLQPGFTTGGVAREGGDGGWLVQEEAIEGVLPGHAARRAAKGAAVDAADMGGDLQPGFTTGGAAREGGDGGWLAQEEAIGGIVAGSGMGVAAIEGWDGPVPDGAIAHAGGAECPEAYPIKGNLPSRFYHLPGDFAYKVTVPEFCFNHEHAAFAAGFTRAPQRGEGGSESGGGAGGSQARSEAKAEARAETRAGNKAQRAEARGRTDVKAGAAPAAEKPAPKGAVHARGKGCPKSHPIKGNEQSGYFHRPQDPSYNFTIPEFCFATEDEAREAGFTLAGNAKRD